ncbi:unnamed protein product [Blepharisma stoltei]|uniref:RING-type domain-containing protein n=1 Tax=Blepharisma stoltei TaxID=1481888 RepID=A0AAU9JHF3_9CILI|nr:unnamed protein product [Blepharisma stoltei]
MKHIFNHSIGFFAALVSSSFILTASLFISFASILTPKWNSFSYNEETFNYGMLDCDDCPAEYKNTNPNCLVAISCKEDSSSELCSIGRKLMRARSSVISSEVIAGLFTILLLERLFYMLFRKAYGKLWIFYALIGVVTSSKFAGFLSYIEITQSKISSNCDNNKNICNSDGPNYLLSSLILSGIGCGFVILAIILRNKAEDKEKELKGLENGYILMNGKVAAVILLGALFTGLALDWDWISFQSPKKMTGTIISMDTYRKNSISIHNLDYNCISGPSCASESDLAITQRECAAFDKLSKAGYIYYWMITFSLLFLVLWLEHLLYLVLKKQFGASELNYVWPSLCVLFNLIGIISWFNLSEVSYRANCRVKASDDNISFCPEDGPILSIVSLFCEFFAAVFYCVIYSKKFGKIEHKVFPGQHKLEKSKLSKKILEVPAMDDCNVTKDNEDSITEKTSARMSGILNRPSTGEDATSAFFRKGKDKDLLKSKGEICVTCESDLDEINIIIGNCGHNIHKKCQGRCDGEKLCEDCLKNLE